MAEVRNINHLCRYPTGYQDPFPDIYCQSTTKTCETAPPTPQRKQGHTAIVYKTYSTADMNNMCPGNYCGPYCNTTSSSCYVNNLDPTDGTAGGRGDLPTPGGLTTGLNASDTSCPDLCCSDINEN